MKYNWFVCFLEVQLDAWVVHLVLKFLYVLLFCTFYRKKKLFAIVFKLNILCKVCLEKRRKCPEIGNTGTYCFYCAVSPKNSFAQVFGYSGCDEALVYNSCWQTANE